MDDRELEARLGARLRDRFDAASVPATLTVDVQHSIAMRTQRVGFALRPRALQLGWLTVAVIVVVGTLAVVGGRLGPAAPSSPPQSSVPSSPPSQRVFVVLPKDSSIPPKADSTQAADVYVARLQALGLQNFTTGVGYGFELFAPADGPSDEDIHAVLAANGDVEFVPLSAPTYIDLDPSSLVGKPWPGTDPVLFGNEGIASATRGISTQALPVLDLVLTDAAKQLFADYTAHHLREYFAVIVDGKVAAVPIINEPIPGGQVELSGGGPPDNPDRAFRLMAATLVGGRLPEDWRDASVPDVIAQDAATSAALAAAHGGLVARASLTVEIEAAGDPARVVWNVEVLQTECSDTASCVGDLLVKVDATTGVVFHTGAMQ